MDFAKYPPGRFPVGMVRDICAGVNLCRCGAPATVTFHRFPPEDDEHFCVRCLDIPEGWRERWWNFLKELAAAGTVKEKRVD